MSEMQSASAAVSGRQEDVQARKLQVFPLQTCLPCLDWTSVVGKDMTWPAVSGHQSSSGFLVSPECMQACQLSELPFLLRFHAHVEQHSGVQGCAGDCRAE